MDMANKNDVAALILNTKTMRSPADLSPRRLDVLCYGVSAVERSVLTDSGFDITVVRRSKSGAIFYEKKEKSHQIPFAPRQKYPFLLITLHSDTPFPSAQILIYDTFRHLTASSIAVIRITQKIPPTSEANTLSNENNIKNNHNTDEPNTAEKHSNCPLLTTVCDFVQTTFGATVEFGPNSVALIRRTPFTEEKELKTTLNRLKFDEKDLKTTQNRLKQPQTSPDGYKSLAKQLWTQRHTLWDLSQTALDESSAAAEMTKVVSSLAPQKLCKAPPSVSGCSLGLPNATTGAPFFHDDNFSRLLSGETFLQRLSAAELETLLRRRFFSVEKDSTGARAKRVLKSENELFRLVARLGRFDLVREFGVPQVYLDGCDRTTELAIGAGLKALQSAGIKLCRTAEHPLALPKDMREDTGVIFASSFGSAGSLVRAAAAYASFSAQNKNNSVFSVGKNKENAVLAKNNSKNSNNSVLSVENNPENVFSAGNNPTPNAAPEPTPYEFDRKLLLKLLIPANAQLAQLTGAAGPNTTINGACASTAQAIALASDWLALGRCRRVLVVAADNVTDPELLPLIGGSFLSLGACSTASEPNCAAVPFDARRSGMVLGMGAVGLLLETSAALSRRGGAPLAQLVASQVGNAASHGSRLDRVHLACEMRRFVAAAARRLGLSVGALARGTLYFAHETGTVGDGGCARAEVEALRAAFGAHMAEVTVCAIKGGLGHAMGANLEDAVAVWSLAKGYAPPVAFSAEAEEGLRPLRLWRGGVHGKRFALRMSAGFGGQVAFLLYRKQESSDKCALI